MSENNDEYEKVCSHPQCYEFPKEYVPRLRKFVSDVKKTVSQEQFDILYDEMVKEGYSVQDLNNVIECCVGYLPYECMLPLEEESRETEGEKFGEMEREEQPSKSEEKKLRDFLERLRGNVSLKLDVVLKPRKLQVSGNSIVVSIPKELNVVYPRGSDVLTVWSRDEKSVFFFGVGSFMSDDNIVRVVDGWRRQRSDWVCFRTVLGRNSLSALVIPKQFLGFFRRGKVNLFWNVEDNVLRVESNLSFQEWVELEERKAKERITTELGVQGGVSGVRSKSEIVPLNIGRCINCGEVKPVRLWYRDENSRGVPLCVNCYSEFEHSKVEDDWIVGLGTVIYRELKKWFGKKEEKEHEEPRI